MRKFKLMLGVFIFLSTLVFANFNDLPSTHWANEAVNSLYNKGILSPMVKDSSTFKGEGVFSRYEVATMIYYSLEYQNDNIEKKADKNDVESLKALINDFKPELETMGVSLKTVNETMDELEKNVNKKLKTEINDLKKDMRKVVVSGEFEAEQNFRGTRSAQGLEELSFDGDLSILAKATDNIKMITVFDTSIVDEYKVKELRFFGETAWGKLDLFKRSAYDSTKAPASFSDPMILFDAEQVQPKEGIIFKGEIPNTGESHSLMVYKTDEGDFYGAQSSYSKKILGEFQLRGSYVEKIIDGNYDTDKEGKVIESTKDQYDRNLALDIKYINRKLLNLYTEGEIVKSDGKQTYSEGENSTVYYGFAKMGIGFLKAEAGYYNAGKDFYSVASSSTRSVFARTGDNLLTEPDRKAYYGYGELNIFGTKVAGTYLNSVKQNEDNIARELIDVQTNTKLGKFVELELKYETDTEELDYNAENQQVKDLILKQNKAILKYEPKLIIKPFLGTKIEISGERVDDPNKEWNNSYGKVEDLISLKVLNELGDLSLDTEITYDLGADTDIVLDQEKKILFIEKATLFISKTLTMKIFNEFELINNGNEGVYDQKDDGYVNTAVLTLEKKINKFTLSLLTSLEKEKKTYVVQEAGGKIFYKAYENTGLSAALLLEYDYNQDTNMSLGIISSGTIVAGTEQYTYDSGMQFGDKYIDLYELSAKEGINAVFSLKTRF